MEYKESYKRKAKLANDENSDVLVNFYCTLNRCDNNFFQLLNESETSGVRQTEIHN